MNHDNNARLSSCLLCSREKHKTKATAAYNLPLLLEFFFFIVVELKVSGIAEEAERAFRLCVIRNLYFTFYIFEDCF